MKKTCNRYNQKIIVLIMTVFALLMFSCQSTKLEEQNLLEQPASLKIDKEDNCFALYQYDENSYYDFSDKYIFFRLYQPYYDNPFCVENILNNCIKVIDVYPDAMTHSAIGFNLNDCFYGLTLAGERDLKLESCTETLSNPYMKKCNRYKSVQVTYAIKVSDEEYEAAKKLVAEYFENPKTKYSVGHNFLMAGYGVKRKLFMSESERLLAGRSHKRPDDTFADGRYDFVCSTFIAYVLANSVQSIRDFFIEKGIDSNYVFPSDLAYLPGVIKLFRSTWVDYNIAAKAYTEIYYTFSPYYSDYLVSE